MDGYRRAILRCVNFDNHNNKFYEIEEKSNGCICRWGAEGTAGNTTYYTRDRGKYRSFDDIYNEKLKHGYTDVSKNHIVTANENRKQYAHEEDVFADTVLLYLLNVSRQFSNKTFRNVEKITGTMVRNALESLDTLQEDIHGGVKEWRVKRDIEEYLSIVPHHGRIVDIMPDITPDALQDFVDSELKKINELKANIEAREVLENNSQKTISERFGVSVSEATFEEEDRVKELLAHGSGDRVVQRLCIDKTDYFDKLIRIDNPVLRDRYEKAKKELEIENEQLLFHGSPEGNWLSIISNGLSVERVAGAGHTGSGLGNGVYFADDINKSLNYTDCTETRYVGIYDVAIGNPYEATGFGRNYRSDCLNNKEHPSVFLEGKKYNGRNEIAIFRADQCCPRYIVVTSENKEKGFITLSQREHIQFTKLRLENEGLCAEAVLKDGRTVKAVYGNGKFKFDTECHFTEIEKGYLEHEFKRSFFKSNKDFSERVNLVINELSKKGVER